MAVLDWIVVAGFMLAVLAGGVIFAGKASGSLQNFFLSGRNLPWWLAGTSILATSFASDTPLHQTRVVREDGLGGAWLYWSGILSHLVITFCFARMWRRTGIVTDAQFIELRYSGNKAALLRGTIALLRGVFLEGLTLAWVMLGMVKVVGVLLDVPERVRLPLVGIEAPGNLTVVAVLIVLVLIYSVSSGLWGVVVTDMVEFVVALVGAYVLAVIAMSKVGWNEGLREGLSKSAPMGQRALELFPDLSRVHMTPLALGVYLGVLWWASDGIDGSGKRAQRFLACRSERDALASGVWNVGVQWILRTWPWFLAALASMVLYPNLTDHESAYPTMMAELLPVGLKGLMVAAFLAAFMSTVDTHLNLCSAYLVNDVYRRFLVKERSEEHFVSVSRFMLVGVALVMSWVALQLPSVLYAYKLKMELIGGLGLLLVVRWFWWRVNAWSELAALGTSIVTCIGLHLLSPWSGSDDFPLRMLIVVGTSTVSWVLVTLATSPEPDAHLDRFYRTVQPPALLWGPVAGRAPEVRSPLRIDALGQAVLCGIFAFCGMFGLGKLLLGHTMLGLLLCAVGAVSCIWLVRLIAGGHPGVDPVA